MKQILVLAGLFIPLSALAVDPSSAADILQKVSQRYKNLQTYQIEATTQTVISQMGQSASGEAKSLLAVGKQGMFRVEQSNPNGDLEIRVSDGKVTWKALPKQKVWSKQEMSQMVDIEEDDTDTADQPLAQDLFSLTQRSFVIRYTGLSRYAQNAVMDKSDKVKFNGNKVECFVIRIPTNGSVNRLYIAKDSYLILRHIEVVTKATGEIQIITDYKRVIEDMPSPDVFEYQPSNASKEVADVMLPSERNQSLVGRPAVDFTLKTVAGSPVHLAELRGKIVLLDFWATWCPPCRHELPTIEALSRKYKDRNVLVYGINDEDLKTAKHFLEAHHPDLETLHDDKDKVHKMYGCRAIPTVLVIDPGGTIVAHFVGE